MRYIEEWLGSLASIIKTSNIFIDLLDILILSYLLYMVIKLVKETRAEQLVKGIILLLGAYFLVDLFKLKAMGFLFNNFFEWGILAVIVMFQPELRRALEKVGRSKVLKLSKLQINSDPNSFYSKWNKCIEAIVSAATRLSMSKIGALIVIERETKLGEQIDTGTIINAVPSSEIFENIFYPNTPLHDGAVIIRDGNILAASCFLPKPQKEQFVSKDLGSRHRAAIGISEVSDAIVIVVSEETGTISVAENGVINRGLSYNDLQNLLKDKLLDENSEEVVDNTTIKSIFKKKKDTNDKQDEEL